MNIALARELAHDPRRVARQFRPRRAVAAVQAKRLIARTRHLSVSAVLDPAQALDENGFVIYRSLIPRQECEDLAATLKRDAGIKDGVEYTRVDATNKVPATRTVLFDERILNAVRAAIGAQARFLQVSDLHYLHDTVGWHRDSVHRAHDNCAAADWSDGQFGVVKAILYLESDNAAMGIMCGSHRSPIEMDRDLVKSIEKRAGQIVIDVSDEPNRRFTASEKRVPFAWKAQVGDVLVFDERMYHAGRRVEYGRVNTRLEAAKLTLSLVFGPDNMHSERLYSYFRYARRELHYRDMPADYQAALVDRGLLLRTGLGNYYLQHPEELRLAHLRNPVLMDGLVAEFARAGAPGRST